MKLKKLSLVLFAAYLVFLFAACQSGKEPVQTPAATTTASATTPTTPTTTAATTEPVQTTTATSVTTAATTTEPPMTTTEPAEFEFSEFRPWEWWNQSETIVPYFSAAYQALDETEPWSVLRVLGEDAYVPLEPLAEEIVADTYNSVYVQFWDVSEMQGREIHTAQMYTDDVMRQMILADRGQFWRIESEALYDYFSEQALTFGRIRSTLADSDEDTVQLGYNDGSGKNYPVVTATHFGYELNALADYAWVIPEQSNLPLSGTEYAVHLYAPDGSDLTVFAESDFVRWRDANGTRWYHLQPKQPNAGWEQGMLASILRVAYGRAVVSYERIAFANDRTPEEVTAYFVTTAYGDNLLDAPAGSGYDASDYAVLDWTVRKVSEDGKTIVGEFSFAVFPATYATEGFLTGHGQFGTGEYEDWFVSSRSFRLVKGEDGLWRCDEMATGRLE